MRPRVLGIVALVVAVIGLGASIASLVDYLSAKPTFCMESGCATVRASEWSHPLGIPLPIFGIVFFATAIALSFIDRPRMRLVWSLGGAAVALGLIALQAFSIHAWCKLCLVADPSALLYAAAVVAGGATLKPTWRASAVAPGVLLVVLALGLWTHQEAAPAQPPPDVVLKEQKRGVVTIVEFVDFECPFCRALDKKLRVAVDRTKKPVRFVRKMVPLPAHEHSVPAAMAYCAAEAQGVGDEMARRLFELPPAELTPAGCEKVAVELGCDVMKYRETFASAELRARIEADMADARAAQLEGFPTIFIGTQKFEGSDHSSEKLLAAIERAGE
ncbi:MAG TPA: vitamin K epoxide reductase family protein [Kofleriaceae bacterium]|nr:vitamin K epoxide reductase family protein [Kofleriaceae bacterium]